MPGASGIFVRDDRFRVPATHVAPERVMNDLDSIYFTARGLPPDDRPPYLTKVCGGDQALRTRVEQMLAVADEAEAFIADLPDDEAEHRKPGREEVNFPNLEFADPPDEAVGTTVGRYKILERVGEGGCGVVYVAEQTEPVRRRVALKVIKPGMDSKQVVSRFEAERQALAMMDHPNIARVLDAGTTESGRPYFVMELVRGIRITDYCDQNNLSTTERLDLFIKVCQAIQHAHQKGIIHRDIKPSNILVTLHDGVPVPKVIDFGIAKAIEGRLTDATVYTQLHHFIGTPAYMSPEQAEMSGLDIDTRSDIYSLGVLLYELLSGSTPFDAKELLASGLDAMRKTIREKSPMRPSTRFATLKGEELSTTARRRSADTANLLHQLKGDLDWIVMKCLEKDRTRRYDTANGLTADLKRHLNDEPVVARPPSAGYRFQKAFRRNRLAFTAAAAVAVALLAGTGVSTWQARQATRAREAEFKQRIAAQDAQAHAVEQQKKAEASLKQAEWLVYAGKLMLAQTDFESGNGALALHYLDECQEKLRGWEYRYLRTRIDAPLTITGHQEGLNSVAFGPDGKRIVTGSADKTAKVWDAATGKELLALNGHIEGISGVAFSPDGTRIVTSSRDGTAKVWDSATGKELLTLKGHTGAVRGVAFSPDGQRIVTSGDDQTAKVWDAATGKGVFTLKGHTHWVRSVAFSPDGRRIATGSFDRTAKVWDAATSFEVLTLKHTHWVSGVAFSPDGNRIVTVSDDRTAKVWDAVTGHEFLTLKEHTERVTSVAFSPNGLRIVTGSADQTARVWDAATGQEIFVLKGHAGEVRSVAFSPGGKHIVTASEDKTAKVWDAENGQQVPTLKGHGDFVSSIAFSPDGQRIVTGSGDGTAQVWDTATGGKVLTINGSASRTWSVAGIWGVAFSPDGTRIVTGSQDKTARVWDAVTGGELLSLTHANAVSSVAFNGDGNRIVTGVGEWWANPGKEPGEAKVWDAATGEELLALKGHTGAVRSVALSPDGKRIVTGSNDRTARVWDTGTGQEVIALKGHTELVWSVAFSPDGNRIVTGIAGANATVKVWCAAPPGAGKITQAGE